MGTEEEETTETTGTTEIIETTGIEGTMTEETEGIIREEIEVIEMREEREADQTVIRTEEERKETMIID